MNILKNALTALVFLGAVTLISTTSARAETLHVYGPGGPTPAMKEIAKAFEAETGNEVIVTAGPTGKWMDQAKIDADLIYSGSENMMTAFVGQHGAIAEDTIMPLYLRPSALLVRKGNPKNIEGIRTLLTPGMSVMVVQGAGQVGMWEDVVGRLRNIDDLKAFRDNIVYRAGNSGLARQKWNEDETVDAWLIWNHWQIDNADLADMVEVEPDLRVYRDTGIGLTVKGQAKPEAAAFITFLQSQTAQDIFAAHGWQRRF